MQRQILLWTRRTTTQKEPDADLKVCDAVTEHVSAGVCMCACACACVRACACVCACVFARACVCVTVSGAPDTMGCFAGGGGR